MTMTSTWPLRFGAALLGALLTIAIPASAGDGCCGEAKEEKPLAAATPQECFKEAACAIEKGDVKVLASQLSVKSLELAAKKGEAMKEGVSKCEETQKKLNVTAEKVKEMSGKDLMLTVMISKVKEAIAAAKKGEAKGCGEEKGGCCGEEEKCCEISEVKIDGDKATALCPLGQPLAFVKEDGAWKMDISAMLEKGCCEEKCEEKPKE
ncbi:MAG: hypothetical protein FD180_3434 [Planctomycetota bacterium]|nr:MAG: hypothetical protein FD180_3434 [Planctomycetota bacterium]